jgi:hypothetical protein
VAPPPPLRSLAAIEAAIRESWGAESCDPVDQPWSAANAARGQCGTTALVVQDLLGGELLLAEVLFPDGTRQGMHYWNRLAGGVEVDLTREQFRGGEAVQEPTVVERPADLSGGRCYAEYVLLAERVRGRLGAASAAAGW